MFSKDVTFDCIMMSITGLRRNSAFICCADLHEKEFSVLPMPGELSKQGSICYDQYLIDYTMVRNNNMLNKAQQVLSLYTDT